MNNMQKICYSMLLVVINSIGMEKPPIQSDKKQTKQDSLSQRLPNNFVQLLPVALTRSLSPFFSTPGPDQRTVTALGEIRARDNRADIIIEANKNMQQFQQFCQEQYGINPTDEHTDVRTFLEAQTAFLAAHPEEKSF